MNDSDNLFTKILVYGLCFVVLSIGACTTTVNYQDNKAIEKLVSLGANPLDAKCAIRGEAERSTACTVRATQHN